MRAEAGTPSIQLRDLAKSFGSTHAVDGVDLEIADGEFFSMLGPSGSGKTTVLRMIAGFEQPTRGRVFLAGEDVTGRPPFARDVNTVFQDYALFPHMSIQENVEYGLRVKKVPKAERRKRAAEALETVRLGSHGTRRPGQLSGGQRQRVALARALVNRPKVLLLDEPLGALDLKLRREMQIELKQIQRDVGITFVFVTHDQEEALTLSDRIAVFNDGKIQQVATPRDLYESPSSAFVAGFVGTSNLLTDAAARHVIGRDGTFSIRPEKIHLGAPSEMPSPDGAVTTHGVVREVVYLGSANHFVVDLEFEGAAASPASLTVLRQNIQAEDAAMARGERVQIAWLPENVIELDPSPAEEAAPE
ncbi:putative spermidine/putrescine transport system ATP-binding protein [Marmoricola sp. OAE513]|uniref:ABC transporter ATP-binding protein n=1 Tax=Marmoricola sp. OAE513 TaxID=2817894 RepID=UPI001AE970A6